MGWLKKCGVLGGMAALLLSCQTLVKKTKVSFHQNLAEGGPTQMRTGVTPLHSSSQASGEGRGTMLWQKPSPGNMHQALQGRPVGRLDPRAPKMIDVDLPDDRCKPGLIRFGGIQCEVLGRGRTEFDTWVQNADYGHGTTLSGRKCSYLKSNKTGGATPKGRYTVSQPVQVSKKKRDKWGYQQAMLMSPKVKNGRTEIMIHSSAKFPLSPEERRYLGKNFIGSRQQVGPTIDEEGFSTLGCLRLHPMCIDSFKKWRSTQKGSVDMVVR